MGSGSSENPTNRETKVLMKTEARIRALNTSNAEKIQELRKFLGPLDVTCLDLREPDADPLTVAAVKALQAGPGVGCGRG